MFPRAFPLTLAGPLRSRRRRSSSSSSSPRTRALPRRRRPPAHRSTRGGWPTLVLELSSPNSGRRLPHPLRFSKGGSLGCRHRKGLTLSPLHLRRPLLVHQPGAPFLARCLREKWEAHCRMKTCHESAYFFFHSRMYASTSSIWEVVSCTPNAGMFFCPLVMTFFNSASVFFCTSSECRSSAPTWGLAHTCS